MTKEWFLVKESNQNMDVAVVCIDALCALEQMGGNRRWNDERIETSLNKCERFLSEFVAHVNSDPFLFALADSTARSMRLRPSELLERIKTARMEIAERKISKSTGTLLHSIIRTAEGNAIRKCELMKPIML